jgi:hypothetical protein
VTSADAGPDPYGAGFAAGVISTRLDGLEAHDIRANGHLAELLGLVRDIQSQMEAMRMELARLGQDAVAKEATVQATATAVESARVTTARQVDQQRERSETVQIPWPRVLGIAAVLIAAIGLIYTLTH